MVESLFIEYIRTRFILIIFEKHTGKGDAKSVFEE
jgi:hypothetical protein